LPHHPSGAVVKSPPAGGTAAIVLAVATVPERVEAAQVVLSEPMVRRKVLAAGRPTGHQKTTVRTPEATGRNLVARADRADGDAEAAAGDRMLPRHEPAHRTVKDRTSSSEVLGASPERVRARWKSH
jgi:hypothetical protein